ncbi:MAG: RNA-binding S4 domain-containing protein [Gammaproteobacteria bacterium]|nr:RNA-binding S4 domain-containing protein [Gammaproteobacteria bacterium]
MSDAREVEITKEPVELYKILKFEGMASSGAEAKLVIANGLVLVNGEIETRKRKKIVSGDIIEFSNELIKIKLIDGLDYQYRG